MVTPLSRTARQGMIIDIINTREITNQQQLMEILADAGMTVTQATLSRDLDELGARKVKHNGITYYVTPGGDEELRVDKQSRLGKISQELLTGVDAAGSMAVLRTPPGAAQYLASVIDRAGSEYVMACIAGDDTIFALAQPQYTGQEIADYFQALANTTKP